MLRTPQQLREDLLAIWHAGLDGVRVDRLMAQNVSLGESTLRIAGEDYALDGIGRIVVIGGGKASGGMAAALETLLEPIFDRQEIVGWVNVPEDCARPLKKIYLHPARPMGVNEPTSAAVEGTLEMLRLAESLTPEDLCICLLSGGGSALLPAPMPEISLQDKLEVTRFLSGAGATIQELNTVRKQLSRIKGGGLRRICRGRRLVSLILSDVLGDPLDVIASGPTVENPSTAADALDVLTRFEPNLLRKEGNLHRVARFLRDKADSTEASKGESGTEAIRNIIIGNNALAVDSAGEEALRRGYSHAMYSSPNSEGLAEDLGAHLADLALEMRKQGPDCLIHGGEPVVRLAPPEIRGRGGRNQQLVLAAMVFLLENTSFAEEPEKFGVAILSGGTDGEDGPTDAAGAWIDPAFFKAFFERKKTDPNFDPGQFLQRNDAYRFFEPLGTLLQTGPTETNVCDIRVVLVDRVASES